MEQILEDSTVPVEAQVMVPRQYRRKLSLEAPGRRLSPAPPFPRASIGRQRKLSFPAASMAGIQLSSLAEADAVRRYRRFSNVSDAVSRKLSTTLGWRTVSVQEVVTESKSLCGQHIRATLKKRGLFNRKLGLQRLRSAANLPGGLAVCDVFMQLEGEQFNFIHI